MIRRIIAGALLVLLGLTISVYAGGLFTQNFSSVPATTSVLTPNCSTLFSSPATVAPGSSGGLFFGCPTAGCATSCTMAGPAITVAADGAATPTFAPLPSDYINVTLVNVGGTIPPTGPCGTFSGPTALKSGTSFSFTLTYGKGNTFYYCVAYNAPAGTSSLPLFQLAWTQ